MHSNSLEQKGKILCAVTTTDLSLHWQVKVKLIPGSKQNIICASLFLSLLYHLRFQLPTVYCNKWTPMLKLNPVSLRHIKGGKGKQCRIAALLNLAFFLSFFFLQPLWIKMWLSEAHVLSFRFHIALDPVRLVIWGLTCMAGREKDKCEQYGPLGAAWRQS